MMNGCICCTVRQDLVVVSRSSPSASKQGDLKLDAHVIETTGMADPAPVAQTFFVDDEVKEFFRLDGIVTLVDAKHVEQHLDDPRPRAWRTRRSSRSPSRTASSSTRPTS